nr:MAG TPA_asm: hypothetical protein [Caudoviricetes sp.]
MVTSKYVSPATSMADQQNEFLPRSDGTAMLFSCLRFSSATGRTGGFL